MLELQDVSTFIRRKPIVMHATFDISPGQIVGLIGPNGAGKTTIMKTILGLTKFTGTIRINQMLVTENNHSALTHVGALIEHPAIYPFLTGRQNLTLYSHDQIDLMQLVTQLELTPYIDRPAKDYSLGMKQKLGIAIALLNQPQLVILDEPMNGLDIEATILVRNLIKQRAAQGTTFLISSHILSELQKIMTRIILVNNGQIIINQPIITFNQLHQTQYRLLTNDQSRTITALQNAQVAFTVDAPYLIIKQADRINSQKILRQDDLYLTELTPVETSFEKLIVTILENQRGLHHEN
ncbi:ABC transporter ATP-binding protein [Lactiplantibacillus pentosus]|uniref:ABC transporter ATP-binding protein n=1 Tax=Lactiplantibacillus pentosus TaxID=1589 RepID=UPI001ADDC25F|nr:ATP-binding cassette domain-containing protein [Lactiplantibacillus pentosus]MBO9165426.1 ATP-binding cassette domain-containing protein [Lactiplantibacillus pentosus]MCT3309726.1 ATP-binding cassette domain-containing protein [Lactiplantibacillus pentosus]